jgi:hypothetical protein
MVKFNTNSQKISIFYFSRTFRSSTSSISHTLLQSFSFQYTMVSRCWRISYVFEFQHFLDWCLRSFLAEQNIKDRSTQYDKGMEILCRKLLENEVDEKKTYSIRIDKSFLILECEIRWYSWLWSKSIVIKNGDFI